MNSDLEMDPFIILNLCNEMQSNTA